jgi:hypothetical protein
VPKRVIKFLRVGPSLQFVIESRRGYPRLGLPSRICLTYRSVLELSTSRGRGSLRLLLERIDDPSFR